MLTEKEIEALFKKRRRELRSDAKNKDIKNGLKGVPLKDNDMWKQFLIDGQHRIAELEYIIAEILERKIK